MQAFTRSTKFASGTSLKTHITVSYPKLIELFGQPDECDGYKVSGEFTFEASNGELVTLYDWKKTSLYDSTSQSPQRLRERTNVELNIGGNNAITAQIFALWLQGRLATA